ncbi:MULTISPECIES: permease of phosphate ABC transporter [Oscillospiraceae]|jgi:hypothetical protein|uniref:Permease of phosphate ABC transporter n=1 Tax=Lawsonibacter faecis TaxID=2763052 RepID=A0A8J6JAQ8_9FIRM|nr:MULTISPECIES: permease of phosphate ABC transporter [Oscillospiraceae]MTQ97958.1 permease of phosphate ABC transporter [Pseudoflavonifractor sp. BIOML-A16]MTR05587.1 permease of phosphate ABC transporter [Pseudoflavonifractor sp. BIOML-A15]MTR32928.1 permease of phosphate ABC transporter [Pseudoflavonifractor sp. BIOML-A14]MTR74269.1 permease of phosphate ABC transporter [Pseudoflavonifractor sp. BIOML-A18]MTS65798.1 permease of phosphate ABC transporter [Pseudoflavonifractor sp. BIOML-A5]
MKQLIAAGNLFLKKMDLTDMALVKLCTGSLGVLLGLRAARKHRKGAGFAAGVMFVLTLLPLLAKWINAVTNADEED